MLLSLAARACLDVVYIDGHWPHAVDLLFFRYYLVYEMTRISIMKLKSRFLGYNKYIN